MPRGLLERTLLAGALMCLVGAVYAPLPTYAASLAIFGLPHVLAELRYIDDRFAARIPKSAIRAGLALLVAVVVVRLAAFAGILHGPARTVSELALVIALIATVVPLARRRERGARTAAGLALLLGAGLLAGTAYAPVETLVLLAFLHNLTPVGFLAERLTGRSRTRCLLACLVLFVGVPVLIVGGALASTAAGPWGSMDRVGTLMEHTRVFVPSLVPAHRVVDLFAAAVWLQGLHYLVVLGILPGLARKRRIPGQAERPSRSASARADTLVAWPRGARGRWTLVAAGAASAVLFLFSFRDARALYGIAAAVHAWVEIPILLAAPWLVGRKP